ncbi:hypothetical protein ABZ422_09340 [Micromonospora zamorensis]|uniref:hypothetical protein n=1 Tax=Micromonospora zamorensis TaxID=709883 RepID=UPI0033DD7996
MRATKSLPTDRMKFEAQVELLQRFGRLSGSQKRAVTSEEVAKAQGVMPNTASLNNGFFVDAGWLQRSGRGKYTASDALLAYTQRVQFDAANAHSAAALLAEEMKKSWYWQVLSDQVSGGGLLRTEAMVLLSTAAGAGQEYKVQLENVLQWLQFVGLVQLDEKFVRPGAVAGAVAVEDAPPAGSNAAPDEQTTGDHMDQSKNRVPERKDVVLAFSLDFKLSAGELKSLSPDQIRALFEAVGTVAALTAPKED